MEFPILDKKLAYNDNIAKESIEMLNPTYDTNTNNTNNERTKTQRYISIDFLRGLAIVFMLILHIISDTLDIEYYTANLSTVPIMNIFALILMPFLGGLAGLFLLVSSISNGISIRRNLMSASPKVVVLKQAVGGLLIICFGMFSEAFLGYHGAIGEIMQHLDKINRVELNSWRYIAYLFETLHAIGWCTLLNGMILGIIIAKYNPRVNNEKIIRIYWYLILFVIISTPIVWAIINYIIPGYPFETNPNTLSAYYLPITGISPFKDFVIYFFVNPLAAPVEPVFPYLATTFLGTIIGFRLIDYTNNTTDNHTNDIDSNPFVMKYMKIGIISFLIGVIGLTILFIRMNNMDQAMDMYIKMYNHRLYISSNNMPCGWFFQYLALNGFSLLLTMFTIRLVECRGVDVVTRFASFNTTTFIRRFGFVAFTVYVIQWVYYLIHFIITALYPGYGYYDKLSWFGSWCVVIITFIALHFILKVWERYGYVGSLEWAILSVATVLLPVKKQVSLNNQRSSWWQKGKLNVDVFYDSKWLSLSNNIDVIQHNDQMLVTKLFYSSFVFPPLFLLVFRLMHDFERNNGASMRCRKSVCFIGIVVFCLLFLLFCFVSLGDLGLD